MYNMLDSFLYVKLQIFSHLLTFFVNRDVFRFTLETKGNSTRIYYGPLLSYFYRYYSQYEV